MRWYFFFLSLSFFINENSLSQTKVTLSEGFGPKVAEKLRPFYEPSRGQIEDLLNGEVISLGKVDSPNKNQQRMFLFVSGIHPRNCQRAMRKLSLYEQYSTYMDFIKESSYSDKDQKISLTFDHTLLPFPMVVAFKIPRITKEGVYPFTFDHGFLKDLKGTIIVQEFGKNCMLSLKTDWVGPESKIPNIIFETFVQTVGKLGLEHLIRVSYF